MAMCALPLPFGVSCYVFPKAADVLSALTHHVVRVFSRRPKEEVIWVNAAANIAAMAYQLACRDFSS
jgi:1,2-phenylacetyl-CoA epoxidase PaaB subunit